MQEKRLILIAALFYLLLGAVGLAWAYYGRGEWLLSFSAERPYPALELLLLASALGLHILFDIAGPKKVPAIARFWNSLHHSLGPLHISTVLLLSLLSAYGEELFFRGALQPAVGYLPATVLFALSHFPPQKSMLIWPFYALAMGAVLGLLRILGGDIYSAVLLHFLANTVSLYLLRKSV
ncbi:MAG: CPBP family intramembrane glutamic endopeptidase [bacterium]